MAITAVARKLVTVAYLILKSDEPYRYAKPELMREKFSRLRSVGEQESAAANPRRLTDAGARLPEVCEAAGLPPAAAPGELPAGESRMLAERGLGDFVAGLYEAPVPGPGDRPAGRPAAAHAGARDRRRRADRRGGEGEALF